MMIRSSLRDSLVFVGALSLLACNSTRGDEDSAVTTPIPVRVMSLEGGAAPATMPVRVTGLLSGKAEVPLAFKLGGVIASIAVDAGQRVRAGDTLAQLNLTEIASQVASATEAQQRALREVERASRLFTDSVVTLAQLEDARTAFAVAQNTLDAAIFNADYAVIRAPDDGLVLARMGEPGQLVEPGRPIVVLRTDGSGMILEVGLSERDAMRIAIGDTAEVTFDALADQRFSARVTQRAGAVTPGTGDYATELTLAGSARSLPSGLVARARLYPRAVRVSDNPVIVPFEALVDADGDSAAVFLLAPDRTSVVRRVLKLSNVSDALFTNAAVVAQGLDGTETIVTVGMSRLVHGALVRVVNTPDMVVPEPESPRSTVTP